jgi:hypothetical protein
MSLILFVPVGILLALIPYSYPVRELLACWLFFGLLLVAITPIVFGVVHACYAGSRITRLTRPSSTMRAIVSPRSACASSTTFR